MEKHAEAEFNPRIPTTPFRRGYAYRDREAQAMQKTAVNNAARNSARNAVRIGMAVTGPKVKSSNRTEHSIELIVN